MEGETPESAEIRAAIFDFKDPEAIWDTKDCARQILGTLFNSYKVIIGVSPGNASARNLFFCDDVSHFQDGSLAVRDSAVSPCADGLEVRVVSL